MKKIKYFVFTLIFLNVFSKISPIKEMTDHSAHDHSGHHPPTGGEDHSHHMMMMMTVSELPGIVKIDGIFD